MTEMDHPYSGVPLPRLHLPPSPLALSGMTGPSDTLLTRHIPGISELRRGRPATHGERPEGRIEGEDGGRTSERKGPLFGHLRGWCDLPRAGGVTTRTVCGVETVPRTCPYGIRRDVPVSPFPGKRDRPDTGVGTRGGG